MRVVSRDADTENCVGDQRQLLEVYARPVHRPHAGADPRRGGSGTATPSTSHGPWFQTRRFVFSASTRGGYSGALWPFAGIGVKLGAEVLFPDLPLYGDTVVADPAGVRYEQWVDLLCDLVRAEKAADDRRWCCWEPASAVCWPTR